MKYQRTGAIAGLFVASAFALSACGSDNVPAGGASGGAAGAIKDCQSGQLTAEGSTAQGNAVDAWKQAYATSCGANITYNKTGSGAGITSFTAGKVAFAGSDSALKDDERPKADARCKGGKAVGIPAVVSPISVVYKLAGVDKLSLSPEAIAGIFAGKITKWNDPQIVATNAGAKLPATTITTVHRSKDSGTTDNFTKFLDAQAKSIWTFGDGKAWKAPGGKGVPGSSDIAASVNSTEGSISYVDYADVKKNKLPYASLNFGGQAVELNDTTVGAAITGAKVDQKGNDIKLDLDYGQKKPGSYPLALVTYEITCDKGLAADEAKLVKSFLSYATSAAGQDAAAKAGHSKLPAALQQKAAAAAAKIA